MTLPRSSLRSLLRPLLRPLLGPAMGVFTPGRLYSAGQPGAFFEPSDFGSLWQDSAGTVPVTAVEQPVGRASDKSGRGNHASQATAAARPVVSQRKNLLTFSEQLDNAAWFKDASFTILADAETDPIGGQTADRVTCTAPGQLYNTQVVGNLQGLTHSAWVRRISGTGSVRLLSPDGLTETDITASLTTAWQRFSSVVTPSNTGIHIYPGLRMGGSNDVIAVWGFQVEQSPTATAYQRIAAATDYTPGFSSYLTFDGVDDSLVSPTGGGGTGGFFLGTVTSSTAGAGTNRVLYDDSGYRVRINAQNQLELGIAKSVTTFGADVVTNGDFATDTVWTKGAGWAIAAGVATATTSSAALEQAVTLIAGRRYEIVYTVTTATAGSVTVQLTGGPTVAGTARTTAATFTEILEARTGNTTLGFLGAGFSGSIDNVVVREVQDFTLVATADTVSGVALVTAWDDGTNLNVQLGSGAVASVARGTPLAGTAQFTLGKANNAATHFLTGRLYPIVYRAGSGLSATERANVQGYLRRRAGLP